MKNLKEIFDYNPETGDFTWKTPTSPRVKVGDLVGCLTKDGYYRASFSGKRVLVHRLIWMWYYGETPEGDIDHINRNRKDNRIENLRCVSRRQNLHNMNCAGFHWSPSRKKFVSQIRGDKHTTIGYFDNALDARAAYLRKKKELGLYV